MLTQTPFEPHAKTSLRILYAEDVPELRDLARAVFKRDGHLIECVKDGNDALSLLEADLNGHDLLITDHHMPGMSGLELVVRMRKLEFPGKIMVFSSELNPAVMAEYKRLAVDRILFKPVYPSVLREVIGELFSRGLSA